MGRGLTLKTLISGHFSGKIRVHPRLSVSEISHSGSLRQTARA